MIDIKIIADEADMIVNGYAFKRCKEGYRVLNAIRAIHECGYRIPDDISVISMDDIEIRIVINYLEKNREFMEE